MSSLLLTPRGVNNIIFFLPLANLTIYNVQFICHEKDKNKF